MIRLTLPLPPSINGYYGGQNAHRFVRPAGVKFRKDVCDIVRLTPLCGRLEGRLALNVYLYARSKRISDLDNRVKALQDALTHAGVWADDSQIDELHVFRREIVKGGKCVVEVSVINDSI